MANETQTGNGRPLWTVMVYLAGDNNLTDESVYSITEMRQVNTDGRIRVIAQLDPRASRIPTHRYVFNHGATSGMRAGGRGMTSGGLALADDAVPIEEPKETFLDSREALRSTTRAGTGDGETDTGDPKTLFDFISWSIEHYQADHYMVILAGHGAGTEEDFLLRDDNPTNSLSIRELRGVFEQVKTRLGKEIDILGLDVCLMSMAEVCCELNGFVHYMVGSEGYSPTAGWPYQQILKALDDALNADAATTPEELASKIVAEYIGFYSDYVVGGLSVDQSVLNVSASTGLVTAVKRLAAALEGELDNGSFRDAIVLAHWEAQSYNGELFVDLWDFCDLLEKRYASRGVPQACADVKTAIEHLVVKSCFSGVENQFSNGVSIYFPWADVMPFYTQLAFAGEEGADWNSFLQAYVEETRRPPRGSRHGSETFLDFRDPKPLKFSPVVLGDARFRKAGDRKAGDRGLANPIQSMRNPPVTLVDTGLSECLKANPMIVDRLRRLSEIRPRKRK